MQVWLYQSRRRVLQGWAAGLVEDESSLDTGWMFVNRMRGCLGGSHARGAAAGVNKTTNSGASVIDKLQIKELFYNSTFAGNNRDWGGLDYDMVIVRRAIGDPAIEMSRIVAWCVCALGMPIISLRRHDEPSRSLLVHYCFGDAVCFPGCRRGIAGLS